MSGWLIFIVFFLWNALERICVGATVDNGNGCIDVWYLNADNETMRSECWPRPRISIETVSFFLIKTHKTGTETIRYHMTELASALRLPLLNVAHHMTLSHPDVQDPTAFHRYKFSINHIPFQPPYILNMMRWMAPPVLFVTCVRDPLDRAISFVYYSPRDFGMAANDQDRLAGRGCHNVSTVANLFGKSSYRSKTYGLCAYMGVAYDPRVQPPSIHGGAILEPVPTDDELYERFRQRYGLIISMDRMESGLRQFEQLLGVPLVTSKTAVRNAHNTVCTEYRIPTSDDRKRFREAFPCDYRAVDVALRVMHERIIRYPMFTSGG